MWGCEWFARKFCLGGGRGFDRESRDAARTGNTDSQGIHKKVMDGWMDGWTDGWMDGADGDGWARIWRNAIACWIVVCGGETSKHEVCLRGDEVGGTGGRWHRGSPFPHSVTALGGDGRALRRSLLWLCLVPDGERRPWAELKRRGGGPRRARGRVRGECGRWVGVIAAVVWRCCGGGGDRRRPVLGAPPIAAVGPSPPRLHARPAPATDIPSPPLSTASCVPGSMPHSTH